MRVSKNGVPANLLVHRLVLSAFRPIENSQDFDVNHLDGDKSNNRPENLEWCTHQENIAYGRQVLKAWPERSKLMLNPKNFLQMTTDVHRLQRFLLRHGPVPLSTLCNHMRIDIATSIGRERFRLLIKCSRVHTLDGEHYTYVPSENDISFAEAILSNTNLS